MLSNATLIHLENLVSFEKAIQVYQIKSHIPVLVRLVNENKSILIKQAGHSFVANLSNQIIHQLSTRLFPECSNNFATICLKWSEGININKVIFEVQIGEALRKSGLLIMYHPRNSENLIYGIVSDAFVKINQIEFRTSFIEKMMQSGMLDLNSKFLINKYGQLIEQFDYNDNDGLIKFSYLLYHARNNGYNAIKVQWGRVVIVCTNGLTLVDGGDTMKLQHLRSVSIEEFVKKSLLEGIERKLATEERIERTISQSLEKESFSEFMSRLHLSDVSKERVRNRLKEEIRVVGSNEWALSQALTWLGTHERYLMNRPKHILMEAGSMILDHSLKLFLEMDTYTTAGENAYGALLPKGFIKNSNNYAL